MLQTIYVFQILLKQKREIHYKELVKKQKYTRIFGTWEILYNPNFKPVEFDGFKKQAGLPTFTLSVSQYIRKTNAIGIYSKRGKYGGTYALKI